MPVSPTANMRAAVKSDEVFQWASVFGLWIAMWSPFLAQQLNNHVCVLCMNTAICSGAVKRKEELTCGLHIVESV